MSASVEEVTTILARTLMDHHGLHDWKLEWSDTHGKAAGRAYYRPKVILLNREYLLDTAARNIRETILHEIAHALVKTDDEHGEAWWLKLLEIGGDGIWVMNDGRVTFAKPKEAA